MTSIPLCTLSPRDYDAVLFDLDGVLTRTASVHAAAWKKLFDEFLEQRATTAGEAFVRIEAPRGEIGCYIASNGKDKPWRVKFRRPSFHNLQILPKLLEGENIANMVAVLGSIDIVLGEVDC